MRAFTIEDIKDAVRTQVDDICADCAADYSPMYRLAVSSKGHILPVVCYYRRRTLLSVAATQSLCMKIVLSWSVYLVSHDYMREYEFMRLLLQRYPQVEDKAWTADIIPEPEMTEMVTEYAILRKDRPESEHFL